MRFTIGLFYLLISITAHAKPLKGDAGLDRSKMEHCRSVDETIVLSSGKKVNMPLCVSESSIWSAYYLVPYEVALQTLKSSGVYPVRLNGQFALFQFTLIDYQVGTLGPYKEIVANFWTSQNPNFEGTPEKLMELMAGFPGAPVKEHGLYIFKLWVDRRKAMLAGNEIWGSNKSMSKIIYTVINGGLQLKVTDRRDREILTMNWSSAPKTKILHGYDTNFYAGYPGFGNGPTFGQAQTWGTVYQTENPTADQVQLHANREVPFGAAMDDLSQHAIPLYLRYVPNYQLISDKPKLK
jgi:hypothetical protein